MTDFYQLEADEQSQRLTVLAEYALSHWGASDCVPRLIKYRENAVFEVRDCNGEQAVLRVHRQDYHSDQSLDSELRWMSMLQLAGRHGGAITHCTATGCDRQWLYGVGTD